MSTNSITQGEQVAVLWGYLLAQGIHIRFAHRTFQWSNEGKGNAAVHCVIIGFGLNVPARCTLFDYGANIKGDPVEIAARQINPYLVDAPSVLLGKRRAPICGVPGMVKGSQPTDGGHLLLSIKERDELLAEEPQAERWIRPFLGADEFINGLHRYCLWLVGITPAELRAMPLVYARVQAVKVMRLASPKVPTQESASTPYLFGEMRQPKAGSYLMVPRVSSERREFVPIGFPDAATIASDATFTVFGATLYHFAMLNSTMHNAWLRAVGGRLKSDYRYSNTIVYNNYPWPQSPTEARVQAIEAAGQVVLDVRAQFPQDSLADLYDPSVMPKALRDAHHAVDRAVDAAYGYKSGKDDAIRVAFLFERYQQLTSLLPSLPKKVGRKRVAG